jgi:hypothetical protein
MRWREHREHGNHFDERGGPFPDTVRADDHDTAEGLAWQVTVPANGSLTISYDTDMPLMQ